MSHRKYVEKLREEARAVLRDLFSEFDRLRRQRIPVMIGVSAWHRVQRFREVKGDVSRRYRACVKIVDIATVQRGPSVEDTYIAVEVYRFCERRDGGGREKVYTREFRDEKMPEAVDRLPSTAVYRLLVVARDILEKLRKGITLYIQPF